MAIGQKDFQYDKFKTPFFQIEVGDADGKNTLLLPPSLHKLVEKVEILETLIDCNHSAQITITMIEGSREPFRNDHSASTNSLYTDANATNTSGMLSDLEFASLGGSTGFATSLPADIGSVVGKLKDLASSIGVLGKASEAPEKQLGSKDVAPKRGAKYVFEEKNMVIVTWGYREDIQSVRKIAGRISIVTNQFPETGHPKLVFTCLGSSSFLDQITPTKGLVLYSQSLAGADPDTGKPIYTFEDKPTKQVIEDICKTAGMTCIVSDNLLSPKTDKYHTKTIAAGKSFHQTFQELAKTSGAYYVAFIDPKTKKDSVAFISRSDWESKPIISEEFLLSYKTPGSILKNLNVKADFSSFVGSTYIGVSSNGTSIKASSHNGAENSVTYEEAEMVDPNPTSGNVISSAKNLNDNVAKNDGYIAGKVKASPQADDPQSMLDRSKAGAGCQDRIVLLDFSTMGFPRLRPGVVKIGNIGNRYSGYYNINTVTHTIDANGYECRAMATSNTIKGGTGVYVPSATKGKPNDSNETAPMFKAAALDVIKDPSKIGITSSVASVAGGTAMDKYNKTILGTA